jgi:mRNA interferase MazF
MNVDVVKPSSIVLIPFPFSDLKSEKRRPVLTLTYADNYGDFICLAVTSKPDHIHVVDLTQRDMESGNLPKPSWIRTDKIFTLNQSLIIKEIGTVKKESMGFVMKQLCKKVAFYYGKDFLGNSTVDSKQDNQKT